MSNFNKVKTFMKTFGQEVKNKPSFSTDKINSLRYDLIKEELEELKAAMDVWISAALRLASSSSAPTSAMLSVSSATRALSPASLAKANC